MNETTIQLLKTDYQYALKFALDNNFIAIQSKLADKGYLVSNTTDAFAKIMELINSKKDVTSFFEVPYINSATNGTGGYAAYFIQNSAPPANTVNRTMWSGLLTILGGMISGVGTALGGGTGTTQTQAQIDAAKAAADAAAAAKRKQTIIIISVIGGIILIVIAIFVFKPKEII